MWYTNLQFSEKIMINIYIFLHIDKKDINIYRQNMRNIILKNKIHLIKKIYHYWNLIWQNKIDYIELTNVSVLINKQ